MKKILGFLGIINFIVASAPLTIAAKLNNITEEFELKTPITKVTAFYWWNSDENTFTWTKTLPIETNYKYFSIIEFKNRRQSWVEGHNSSKYYHINSPLIKDKTNILLINNTQFETKIAETYYEYGYIIAESEVANLKLILNLTYSNNTIKAKFTAKAIVTNPDFFCWVKTQATFYFKIIVSENQL
ncbi:hypothetical protein C6B38_07650 [Spiroplasma sp. ChiS]|uniref:hypothetical protein n=1 Tax=Spiroplasma sp. ChiS TaxID=2099885 RepID=UPI000CF84926|nr:hypothetical protein [Spiroplasma sp. ChiS]PQP78202.1 hypothetical protein C6B38_07650 [Spiroplasma sp. ChiS]